VITTIILIILALAAAGAFLAGQRLIGAIVSAVLIIVGALTMITVVQPTEVGVPISFGNVGQPMSSGLHVVAPWVNVETYPVRPFPVDPLDVNARTRQSGSVQYRVQARWHVESDKASQVYLQIRSGDEDKIRDQVVDPSLTTAVGNVAVTFDNLEATTQRERFESELLAETQRLVTPYGLKIDQVFVRHIEPDQATSASISQLAQQQQQTRIASERVNTATQEALARAEEAKGLQKAATDVGNMSPTQLQAVCLQAWERVATAAANRGVPVYSQPCSASSGPTPVVSAK
jgi:regulator of protease activity HflC (stomatin/prohibitin superfamily)